MASRQLTKEDWKPVQPTRITIRKAPEPRDEQMRLPKGTQSAQISPADPSSGQQCPVIAVPSLRKPIEECCESPRDPEVVDVGDTSTWRRRGSFWKRRSSKRALSPSSTSQYSVEQSEKSFGILDYYLQAPSPLPSPDPSLPGVPRIETPVIDPAMAEFNFELMGSNLLHSMYSGIDNEESTNGRDVRHSTSGAEQSHHRHNLLDSSPPPHLKASRNEPKETYSLFPRIRIVTPPRKSSTDPPQPEPLCGEAPAATIRIVPSHQQPDTSYRPRKESVSSSVQSRKDSLTSFSGTRRIPLRILSSGSTSTPKTRSTASNSTSTASPPQQSRWSDDTVTSPGVLTTPGPRTSFGSLLGRDSTHYPDCFFEDDDDDFEGEVAPLRRKFRWQRSGSLKHGAKSRKPVGFGGHKNFSRRLAGALLCTCCSWCST